MEFNIKHWDQSEEETHQIFKIIDQCYPELLIVQNDPMAFLQKIIKGFEDSIYCVHTKETIVGFALLTLDQAHNP
jgi:hypothetical protein